MRLRPMLPTLLLAFAVSVVICVLAAGRGSGVTLALAAALFAVQVLLVLLRINVPLWRGADAIGDDWAWSNTVLAALVYAWGATAMFAIYGLTDLVWRHWWQYGLGMTLLAAAALLCAGYLATGRGRYSRPQSLALLTAIAAAQAAAVGLALIYLFASGKLATTKADWAANDVFIAGGATVLLISLASLLTYRRSLAAPQARAETT
jgi:hypothetical protein